jgi:hypothetical protein
VRTCTTAADCSSSAAPGGSHSKDRDGARDAVTHNEEGWGDGSRGFLGESGHSVPPALLDARHAVLQLGVSLGQRREGSQEVFVARYALFLGQQHLSARLIQVLAIHKGEGSRRRTLSGPIRGPWMRPRKAAQS